MSCHLKIIFQRGELFGEARLVLSGSIETPSGIRGYRRPAFAAAISLRAIAATDSVTVDPKGCTWVSTR